MFKKRFRSRTSPPDTGSGSGGRVVPDITVESPVSGSADFPCIVTHLLQSTAETESSHRTTNVTHLLSPDYVHPPLPTAEPAVTMRQEPEAPLPVPNSEVLNVLPPGFVPMGPPTPLGGRNRRPSGPSRPTTPYAEAPLSSGLVYPDPPKRSMTPSASAIDDLYGSVSSRNTPSRGALDQRGSGTLGGLSPLHLDKPLTYFPLDLDENQGIPIS